MEGEPAQHESGAEHYLGDPKVARAPSGPTRAPAMSGLTTVDRAQTTFEQTHDDTEAHSRVAGAGGAERVSDRPEDRPDRSRGTEHENDEERCLTQRRRRHDERETTPRRGLS